MSDEAFPILVVEDLGATRRFYERLGFFGALPVPAGGRAGHHHDGAARRPSASAPPTTTATGTRYTSPTSTPLSGQS
jgi:hypothetical protein